MLLGFHNLILFVFTIFVTWVEDLQVQLANLCLFLPFSHEKKNQTLLSNFIYILHCIMLLSMYWKLHCLWMYMCFYIQCFFFSSICQKRISIWNFDKCKIFQKIMRFNIQCFFFSSIRPKLISIWNYDTE